MEFFVLLQMENLSFTGHNLVENVLTNRSKIRDFYNNDFLASYGPLIILAHIVATKMNASLISKGHPKFIDDGRYPKIITETYQYKIDKDTINTWKVFDNEALIVETPAFVQLDGTFFASYNFMYCSVPKRKQRSAWDFSIFTLPFDLAIWCLLLISLSFVATLAFSGGTLQFKLLSTVAPLLNNMGEVGNHTSNLFILWVFTCLVLVNVYTGELTSQAIIPSPDESFANLQQLQENNYTLLHESQEVEEMTRAQGEILAKARIPEGQILLKMPVEYTGLGMGLEHTQELVERDKVVYVSITAYVLWVATSANHLIKSGTSYSSEVLGKRCYIGKKLVPLGTMYYTFVPPRSEMLAKIFRRLIDTGIVRRWYDESIALTHTSRIQDRVKVIGPTQIIEEKPAEEASKLIGNNLTIFQLCMLGLLGSLFIFICEFFFMICLKPKQKRVLRMTLS